MFKGMNYLRSLLICVVLVFVFVSDVMAYAQPIVSDNGSTLDLSEYPQYIVDGNIEVNYTNLDNDVDQIKAENADSKVIADGGQDVIIRLGEDDGMGGVRYDFMWKYTKLFSGIRAHAGGNVDFSINKVNMNTLGIGLYATGNGEITIGAGSSITAYQRDSGQVAFAESGGRITIYSSQSSPTSLLGNISSTTSGVVSSKGMGSEVNVGDYASITNDGAYAYDVNYWQNEENQQKYGGTWTYTEYYRTPPSSTNPDDREYLIYGQDHYALYASNGGTINIGDHSNISSIFDDSIFSNFGDIRNSNKQNNVVVSVGEGSQINIGENAAITSNSRGSFAIYAFDSALISVDEGLDLIVNGDTSIGVFVREQGKVNLGASTEINMNNPLFDSYFLLPLFNNMSVRSAAIYAWGEGAVVESRAGNEGEAFKINILNDDINNKTANGIYVLDGAEVHLRGKVEINMTNSKNYAVFVDRGKLASEDLIGKVTLGDDSVIISSGTAIYAIRNGYVLIGDNSTITTTVGVSTVYVNESATVEIGDGADISGSPASSYLGVVNAASGTIKIGDNATITQLAIQNVPYGNAIVVDSLESDAGELVIGKNSKIVSKGKGSSTSTGGAYDMVGAHAIAVGPYDAFWQRSTATVRIGENAELSTVGESSYGIFAIDSSAIVVIDDGASIVTKGRNSSGIKALKGGSVTLGDDINIITEYDAENTRSVSYAIFATDKDVSGNPSKVVVGDNFEAEAKGRYAYGIYASDNGTISIGDSSNISTSGMFGHGVYAGSAGTIELGENAVINVQGAYADGIYVTGDNSLVKVGANSDITSAKSHAMYIVSNGKVELGAGTKVTAATGNAAFYAMYFVNSLIDERLEYESVDFIGEHAINNTVGNSTLYITFTGESNIFGDLNASGANSTISMTLEDSANWFGTTMNGSGDITINLQDASNWWIVKDSMVSIANMTDNAAIRFSNIEGFHTVEIGSLAEEGIIEMNVDLSTSDDSGGDFIKLGKIVGTYVIYLNSENGLGGLEELQLMEIADASELADEYALTLGDGKTEHSIQIGAYLYELSDKDTDFAEIWLVMKNLDPVVEEGSGDFVVGLNEFHKAIDATLSDDAISIKNRLWILTTFKRQNFNPEILGKNLTQHVGITTVGMDKRISDKLNIGVLFGLNLGYQSIGEDTTAHISSLTTGVYANLHIGSFTLSGYGRVANYMTYLSILPTYDDKVLSADINTYGYSLSLQASYKFKLLCSGIYITPKAKITYSNLIGGNYDIGGMIIDSMPSKGFVTWLGARIGVDKLNKYGKTDGMYLEAGWIHDTNPSAVYTVKKADEETTKVTLGANRFEAGIGFEFAPLGKSSFAME